jgi:hypothetical protein
MIPPKSKLEKSGPVDINARNRALAKYVDMMGIHEIASRLKIPEAELRLYMHGGAQVPDSVWLVFVDLVLV